MLAAEDGPWLRLWHNMKQESFQRDSIYGTRDILEMPMATTTHQKIYFRSGCMLQ